MNPLVGASLISGGSSLLGGIMSGFGSQQSAQADREWQEKMWHMQNEYNSPLNQRKRMEAGGFNPNLMYGSGSVSNTSAPAPQVTRSVSPMSAISNAMTEGLQSYMQTRMQEEQIKLAGAKTTVEQSKPALIGAQTAKAMADTAYTDAQKEIAFKRLQYYDEQIELEMTNNRLRNKSIELQNSELPRQFKRNGERHVETIANMRSVRRLQELQGKGILQQMSESEKRIEAINLMNELRQDQSILNDMKIEEFKKYGYENSMRKDPWSRLVLGLLKYLDIPELNTAIEAVTN